MTKNNVEFRKYCRKCKQKKLWPLWLCDLWWNKRKNNYKYFDEKKDLKGVIKYDKRYVNNMIDNRMKKERKEMK